MQCFRNGSKEIQITLIIGNKKEIILVDPTYDIQNLSESIVKKYNLSEDAIPFLISNISSQVNKNSKEKTRPRSSNNISSTSSKIDNSRLYNQGLQFLRLKCQKIEDFKKLKESKENEKSFEQSKTGRRVSPKIFQNLYEDSFILQRKLKNLGKKIDQEKLKPFTFKPIIDENSRKILSRSPIEKREKTWDRLFHLADEIKNKKEKFVEMMVQIQNPFRPDVGENHSNAKAFTSEMGQRLYEQSKIKKRNRGMDEGEKYSFSPKITKDKYYYKVKIEEDKDLEKLKKTEQMNTHKKLKDNQKNNKEVRKISDEFNIFYFLY